MKTKLASTLLLSLCVSFPVFAAKIVIPDSFEFLALDGQKVERALLRHISALELSEGSHKIALRYADAVDDPNMRYPDFIQSKPIVLTLTAEGQHTYKLIPDPEAIKQPWSYKDNPKITIVRLDGGSVNYAVIPPKSEQRDLITATRVDSNQNTAAAETTAAASQPKAPSAPSQAADSVQSPANSMLKYWWSQADEKTRQDFMEWVAGQK